LESKLSFDAFRQTVDTFRQLYESPPERVACDMHPDYFSTAFARHTAIPVIAVQHHHAHLAACMAENGIYSTALGIAWDGTGFGPDGTIWGGEFLLATLCEFQRIGHFRPFRIAGGNAAIKEPRRSALGILYEVFGEETFQQKDLPCLKAFTDKELHVVGKMLSGGLNAPLTSSAGRLFDGVASLIGLYQRISFEGQAAMALESLIDENPDGTSYSFEIVEKEREEPALVVIDWSRMIKEIVQNLREGIFPGIIAQKFHNTLIEMAVAMAIKVGEESVVLSGGCFQNKYLTQGVVMCLQDKGFKTYWHRRIPTNDGGISLGQVVVASQRINASRLNDGSSTNRTGCINKKEII
jgi:hydrogenase maturation protein HypF